MKAKVMFITDSERYAGNTISDTPPKESIGCEIETARPLIGWHAHWAEFNGKKYVFAHCSCRVRHRSRLSMQMVQGNKSYGENRSS